MSGKSKGWTFAHGAAGLVAGAIVLTPVPLSAGQARSTLAVSASVADYTRVTPLHLAGALSITPNDVMRGYVDVPEAESISIRSNHPAGHRIVLESRYPAARVAVLGLDSSPDELPTGGGSLALPHRGNPETFELGMRVYLSAGVSPGVYSFPVTTFIEPL